VILIVEELKALTGGNRIQNMDNSSDQSSVEKRKVQYIMVTLLYKGDNKDFKIRLDSRFAN
jgi:hypothetical protein